MSIGAARVAVVLVGVTRLVEHFLKRELRAYEGLTVARVPDAGAPGATTLPADATVLVGTTLSSLRRAAEQLGAGTRVVGMVAVTDEPPVGDVYLISAARSNASPRELAELIRDVAAGHRAPAIAGQPTASGSTRSDP